MLPPLGDLGREWTLRTEAVPEPGVGTTFTITVPGDYEWRLVALNLRYATGGALPLRYPYLRLRDGTRELLRVPLGVGLAGGLSVTIGWAPGIGSVLGDGNAAAVLAPWPAMPLVPGHRLDWLVQNFDPLDAASLITFTVLQRFTGDRPPERRPRPALVTPVDADAILGS